MASQRSTRFSEGYLLCETSYGTPRLCVNRMTIPVPRLKLRPTGRHNPNLVPRIFMERKAAFVLNPDSCTDAFHILEAEAEVFEIRHRIRRHAERSHATLDLVLSLMVYRGGIPLLSDPAERFEAYLDLRSPEFLRGLLALLDMPDSSEGSIANQLPHAA